jgi:enamine deaminase RidA (YjgF/YER057c/UK114 family)
MTITRIESDERMSQVVIHGNTVYLAGQVGEPGEDVAQQTRTTLAEIERLLALAGSDKSKLLTATIWLADIADFDAMNAVWDDWIGGQNPPTRATSEARLSGPEYHVEIIVTAARD